METNQQNNDKAKAAEAIDYEAIARLFHEKYEIIAVSCGYKTRRASAKPWELVPEKNKEVMVETVKSVFNSTLFASVAREMGYIKIEISSSHAMAIETLRRLTGAGLFDCKRAYDDAHGDINLAIMGLRTQGLAVYIKPIVNQLEDKLAIAKAELKAAKEQLASVRDMRDKLLGRLKLMNSRASLAGSPINDKMDMRITEEIASSQLQIEEAEAQVADEKARGA